MYTYENARRTPKTTAKKPRAAKPAKTLTEKQHNAHARSRAAFQRARQIWSAVPGCDPYSALRQAWEEVKRGSIAPNYTKTVKPPKPKKPKKPKKNPLLTSVQQNLLTQAANQETASAYESYEKAAVKELLKMGLIEIVSQQPRFIRFTITQAGHEALEHKAPPMTRRHSLADEVNAEYERRQYPASVLRTARR